MLPGSTTHSPRRQQAKPKAVPRSRQFPKPIEIIHKCLSEPTLFPGEGDDHGMGSPCSDSGGGIGWFDRLHTLNDVFIYPQPELSSCSSPLISRTNAGYEKDAKVVITVTVEGCVGPIRTLIKLGTSVEDTIKLVIQKYVDEGRKPQLDENAASSFDLHVSYFSLESLNRSNSIGEIGIRSFYLRQSDSKKQGENRLEVATTYPATSGTVLIHESSSIPPILPMGVLPSFITRKVHKIMRRMHKLFKVFGCIQSS